jgi:hypothetical protein
MGYDNLLHMTRDPELEPVRRDPRFNSLLETVVDAGSNSSH